jgi:hypothetical protein
VLLEWRLKMDKTSQAKKMGAHGTGQLASGLPKLTVEQIVKKFVTPSSHRMVVQAAVPRNKTNKK